MAKKLRAKVNGESLKDGDLVTVIVQTTVKITDKKRYNGDTFRDVEFTSKDSEIWLDAYEKEEGSGKFELNGATVVKVKP